MSCKLSSEVSDFSFCKDKWCLSVFRKSIFTEFRFEKKYKALIFSLFFCERDVDLKVPWFHAKILIPKFD